MEDSFGLGYALGSDNNNNGCNNGFGDGNGWWLIIILLACFWGNNGFGGFGNNGGGALTRTDLCSEFSFNDLQNGVRGVSQGICDSTFALNNTIVNGFNGVSRDLCTGLAAVNAGISENRFANQQCCCNLESAITNAQFANQAGINALATQLSDCCCTTNRNIERGFADANYNLATQSCAIQTAMANNTRDIIDSQRDGTRAILDYLCQDKISNLQNENQALRLSASQNAQNTYLTNAIIGQTEQLINRIAPTPVPSFTVPAPYPYCNQGYGYNGYNNNCGCGCNSGCGCGCGCGC